MNEDIETIEKNENSKQIFQKTKWITIYEVIDKDYIENSNIFPDAFIENVNYVQMHHRPYHMM